MGDTPTGARTLIGDGTDRDEQDRETRGAEIDAVLMRLVSQTLQRAKAAYAARDEGTPPDPAVPLDRVLGIMDDLIEARGALDRLYGMEDA
jgi:hypothetical protein